jgi:hypothetical protein
VIFYVPFSVSPVDAPREAAAIILTNDLLFAVMAVTIYGIIRTLFEDRWFSFFGTFVCITSSSYLIWVSSAKDHMLDIFLISLIIFGLVTCIYYRKVGWCFFSFFLIGLLAWDRPEIGIFLLFFLSISLIPYAIRECKNTKNNHFIGYLIISPIFTAIGAIPLFVNNYIITNNPLSTTYSVWLPPATDNSAFIYSSTPSISINDMSVSFFSTFFSWMNPHFDTLINDFLKIIILPESGSIGVFILTPIFLVALLSIPLLVKYGPESLTMEDFYLIFPLGLTVFAIFIAYISHFPVLNMDHGVIPDVRYLSPAYLPLNILGLIILYKFPCIRCNCRILIKYSVLAIFALIPVFLSIIFLNARQNLNFISVLSAVSFWMAILVLLGCIISIIILYGCLKNSQFIKPLMATMGFIIMIPFIMQILLVLLYSIAGSGVAIGYTYWMPAVRESSAFIYSVVAAQFL